MNDEIVKYSDSLHEKLSHLVGLTILSTTCYKVVTEYINKTPYTSFEQSLHLLNTNEQDLWLLGRQILICIKGKIKVPQERYFDATKLEKITMEAENYSLDQRIDIMSKMLEQYIIPKMRQF